MSDWMDHDRTTRKLVRTTRMGARVASVPRRRFMSEGRPRANESGPLTTFALQGTGRRCDASMPASTPSEHRAPTEPVRLGEVVLDVIEELLARELSETEG